MTSATPLKALVLDDEADARLIISSILKKAGYDIRQVDTISAARSSITNHTFDLLFLDYNLPDGNSYDLLTADMAKQSPTIICSAYLDSEQIEKFMQLGVKACLPKPLNQERILTEVNTIKNKQNEDTGN